jgi:alanine-synthesizing transaminase
LRVPAVRSDEDLAVELLTQRDAYSHPGHFFDFPGEGYLVVSWIAREGEFTRGVERILSAF